MDSYALPLESCEATEPLQDWLKTQWKYVIYNGQSLQSIYSKSCGDYALFYLKDRARGQSMNEFLRRFSKHDYVGNDHKVGQMLKRLIERVRMGTSVQSETSPRDFSMWCETLSVMIVGLTINYDWKNLKCDDLVVQWLVSWTVTRDIRFYFPQGRIFPFHVESKVACQCVFAHSDSWNDARLFNFTPLPVCWWWVLQDVARRYLPPNFCWTTSICFIPYPPKYIIATGRGKEGFNLWNNRGSSSTEVFLTQINWKCGFLKADYLCWTI